MVTDKTQLVAFRVHFVQLASKKVHLYPVSNTCPTLYFFSVYLKQVFCLHFIKYCTCRAISFISKYKDNQIVAGLELRFFSLVADIFVGHQFFVQDVMSRLLFSHESNSVRKYLNFPKIILIGTLK